MRGGVGKQINGLSNLIKRHIDRQAAMHNLTGVQGRILHMILAETCNGEVFQRDIEEEFNLRRSTATGILQLMEKNGMITRQSVPYDARLKSIVPTTKAAALHEAVSRDIQEIEKCLAQNIAPEDLAVFRKVLEQMYRNLGNH